MKALMMAVALLAAAPVAASNWTVVPAQSSIAFGAEWTGKRVEGRFSRFDAAIRFDPRDLKSASVTAIIDLSSASTNDATVNGSLPGEDWLASGKARNARFVARQFAAGKQPNSYVARGTLTMRGTSVPVELPFTVQFNGDRAVMTGSTRLDRRAFKIGMQSDAGGDWVGFPVQVNLRIVAQRAK